MLLWYGIGAVMAIAVAWFAALLHAFGHAPVVIISLGLGGVFGVVLARLAAILRTAGRKPLIIGAVILSLLVVLSQHAWLYESFRRQWHEARAESAEVAMFRPETPWSPREYFAREVTPRRMALWVIDGALIITAAAGTFLVLQPKRQ
jgi:hypothetical protein